jgi:sugar lactone lactonase YvrE
VRGPDASPEPEHWDAELVFDGRCELGEGPLWDERERRLLWVDIMAGAVHVLGVPSAEHASVLVGQPVGALGLRDSGGLVLAVRDGFALLDPDLSGFRLVAAVDGGRSDLRMNDGACDGEGRFWAGTMALDEAPGAGALYRLAADGTVTTVLTGVSISNGLAWSPDGRILYYVDTPTGRVDAFDYAPAPGAITNRRPVVEIEPGAGYPDGLTVDETGALWVALWEGGCVRRYTPQGALTGVVRVPAARVTSCVFGGEQLDELYVTTARPDADDPAQPAAGGLFRVHPGVRGLPSPRFAG